MPEEDNAPMQTDRMTIRRPSFAFAERASLDWHGASPEFSQIVNAASLAMPYLEPYLIATMRKARDQITDPALAHELDLYCGQEAAHYRLHRVFNDTLKAQGGETVAAIEAQLATDYAGLGETRSLKFNLAYAEGFESMALAIGHMLIEDRAYFFGGGDSAVSSLVLWHFVEEIEHKCVAFDVFEHVAGGYFWRIYGLMFATGHIFWRTRAGYQALLKRQGLWRNWRSRLRLARLLLHIFGSLIPKFLRILNPRYHPNRVPDPAWGLAWSRLHAADAGGAARLDTDRLGEREPLAVAA